MRTYVEDINPDFTCKNCGAFVSSLQWVSGVIHRNHCPFCLYSRHLDLFQVGDRLSACKSVMMPVGLTLKRSRNKYNQGSHGELMLVHRCTSCEEVSINRIAADDDPAMVMDVFKVNLARQDHLLEHCQTSGIRLLQKDDCLLVETMLYGHLAIENDCEQPVSIGV